MKNLLLSFKLLPTSAALVMLSSQAQAQLPSWYGQPNTTRTEYIFDSGVITPSANIFESPFGAASALVTVGAFSSGWQDPLAPFSLSGITNNGAWDLGRFGTINVTLPIASAPPDPGFTYTVDFDIYAIFYLSSPIASPTLETFGNVPSNLVRTQTFEADDPGFPGATWQRVRWTGSFQAQTATSLQIGITGAFFGSVIDDMGLFTRTTAIPEPSAALLICFSAIGLVVRRRRQ
jgi:hypothetical protein